MILVTSQEIAGKKIVNTVGLVHGNAVCSRPTGRSLALVKSLAGKVGIVGFSETAAPINPAAISAKVAATKSPLRGMAIPLSKVP